MIYKILLAVLLTTASVFSASAQSMLIETSNGSVVENNIANIQKFDFPDNNLVLKDYDHSTQSFSLVMIKKISFGNLTSAEDHMPIAGEKMLVYPNPVFKSFRIENAPEKESDIFIYTIQGSLIRQTTISGTSQEILVSLLPKGVYFIQLSNQTLKFIKL